MYLTAQKVTRATTPQVGINAYLYRHGPNPPPAISWDVPDVNIIATEFPGVLAAAATEIQAGGNAVRSYLDVACADDVAIKTVLGAMRRFEEGWSSSIGPQPRTFDRVALRFGCSLAVRPNAAVDLHDLCERAARLLQAPIPIEHEEPLEVLAASDESRTVFSLSQAAVDRLRQANGPRWSPASVSIDHDVRAQFVTAWGAPYEHVAPVVTGRPLDGLPELGGVRFVDRATGEVLWEWPRRDLRRSYCLVCHQHDTLVPIRDRGVWHCTFCESEQPDDGLWIAALT